MAYDADAHEALEEGLTPRCHEVVGVDAIFAGDVTDENICVGHEHWAEEKPGYVTPITS